MGGYKTIQSAIDASKDGDVIVIMPGEYEESIKMFDQNRHIVGVSREACIIKNGLNKYDTPPMEVNIGSIENLTIIADDYDSDINKMDMVNDGAPYAVHADHGYEADEFELCIRNCTLISKWCAAIGMGVHYNQKITVDNCDLISYASEKVWSPYTQNYYYMGALYVHNESSEISGECGSYLLVKDCVIRGYDNAITLYSLNNGNGLTIDFINNTLSSDQNGTTDSNIFIRKGNPSQGCLDGEDLFLGDLSHGNNLEILNNE